MNETAVIETADEAARGNERTSGCACPRAPEYIALARLALSGLADIVAAARGDGRRPQARADRGRLELGPARVRRRAAASSRSRTSSPATRSPSRSSTTGRASTRTGRRRSRARSSREGGLGIAIIRTIADEFELELAARRARLAPSLREAAAPAGLIVVNSDNDAAEAPRRLRTARRSRTGVTRTAPRGAAGRRRRRHRARRPDRAPRRDVGGERDERRGPGGRGGARTARSSRRRADGAAYRLRLVAHDPAAYERFYNVVANPTLWFLQHYLWGLGSAPDSARSSTRRGARATSRQRGVRRGDARGARPRARRGGSLPRLPPLSRAAARAGGAARRS